MSFLTPWLLYVLGALALPVLIHLWQRRQVLELPISTLRFLKAAAARTRRSAKIENLLLLLLRCLVYALVILAVARPVMLAKTAQLFGTEIPRTLVIVLDNSLSMGLLHNHRTRLEAAKAAAHVLLDNLKQGDRVALIAADDRAQLLVAEPTVDRSTVARAIDQLKPSETRSDFAPALREAAKIVARAERGIRQIYLFSDNQQSAWQGVSANPSSVFDTRWQQTAPQLVVVRPDEFQAANACVKSVRIDSPFLAPGNPVRGTAVIQNYANAPLQDLLVISLGNDRMTQIPVEMGAGASIDVAFEFQAPFLQGRWAGGKASLSGDNLAADDSCFFTLPLYRPPQALVVDAIGLGPERLRPGFYLRKALAAGSGNAIQLSSVSSAELEETALENQTVVFLADPGHLGDRSVFRLERLLEAGGTIVLLPGDTGGFENLPFLPGKPLQPRSLSAGRQPVGITAPEHPLFAGAWDSGVPFPALPQQRLLDWKLNENAQVLLKIGGDKETAPTPLLFGAPAKAGHCFVLNASADRSWGDLPLSPAFVPLVQQLARFSSGMGGQRVPLTVGEPVPLPAILPNDKPVTLVLPNAQKLALPPRTASNLLMERSGQSGIYEASAGTQSALLAINADRAESDPKVITPEALKNLVPDVVHLTGADALAQWLSQKTGMTPVWPPLLLAAFVVLLLEGLLSNLAAGRRSQGEEKPILTGRLNRRRMGVPFFNPEERI